MQILNWKIDSILRKEAENNYRTDYTFSIKEEDALSIIRDLTFDGSAPNITIVDIERFFDFIEDKFIKKPIAGVGLEVGAGPLVFSAILAKRQEIFKMYGVEICSSIVENLAPKISNYILGDKSDKVIGVIGSFDNVELPDRSVDFIFDFFSLHHSADLSVTLKECSRVLKPGGFILCLDKARPDHYEQRDLDELINTEYDENYKKQFNLPLNIRLTRRMNGEREYRLKDWKKYFNDAGFSEVDYYLLDKIAGLGPTLRIKTVLSILPVFIQKTINNLLPSHKYGHKFIHESSNRIYSKFVNPFRKEMSLMIAYKK